jgi:hypothetical protein
VIGICLLCWSTLAQTEEPPFEWDSGFSSPGTSLSINVVQILSSPPDSLFSISIKSTGFTEAASTLALWQRRSGSEYYKRKPPLSADGVVQDMLGNNLSFLGDYIRGQAYDIALVDEATNRRAQAKITPFPITAIGSGECKASAEVQTASGLVWVIMLAGFNAGEDVTIQSIYKKETLTDDVVASENGEVAFPILYPKRSKGNAKITALGSAGCNVTLDFAIGKSALKAK